MRIVALCLVLLGLAGCVTVDADLRIGRDGTVSGVVTVSLDRAAMSRSGRTDDAVLRLLDGQERLVGRFEQSSTDRTIARRYRFDRMPLADFGRVQGWRFVHTGRELRLSGAIDLPAVPGAVATVRLTFPGRVRAANGAVAGASVTWHPRFGRRTVLTARAGDGTTDWTAWVVAGGLLALAAVGAAGGLLVVGRSVRHG